MTLQVLQNEQFIIDYVTRLVAQNQAELFGMGLVSYSDMTKIVSVTVKLLNNGKTPSPNKN